MKKIIGFLLAFALMAAASICMADRVEVPEVGMSFEVTEEMQAAGLSISPMPAIASKNGYTMLNVTCYDEESLDELYGQYVAGLMTGEQYAELIAPYMCDFALYYVMSDETAEDFEGFGSAVELLAASYPTASVGSICSGDGWTYILVDFSENIDRSAYAESLTEKLDAALPLYAQFRDSVEFIDVQTNIVEMDGRLTFTTQNLADAAVTDEVFTGKTVTMMNVWATWCNPCVNEMPELAKLAAELPENAQILFLCADATSADDKQVTTTMKKIAEKAGLNPENVLYMLDGQFGAIDQVLTAFPTTFFFDENGEMLDDIVIGADVAGYKKVLDKLLQ